eukprot:1380613-Prymnesium_polylepis.1
MPARAPRSHEAKLARRMSDTSSQLCKKRWKIGAQMARVAPDPFSGCYRPQSSSAGCRSMPVRARARAQCRNA